MTEQLGSIGIGTETDVLAARQRARELAGSLGFDTTDQVRVATAISELGRLVGAAGAGARLDFAVRHRDNRAELVITAHPDRALAPPAASEEITGLTAVRRLMDEVTFGVDEIVMVKAPAPGHRPMPTPPLTRLREQFGSAAPASPMDELRREHDALLVALAEMHKTQDELARLNEELQETNRGVVALYAELDERGEQLRAANDAKSRFLASVSHELRGPLNSINGLAGLLREPDSDPLTPAQDNQVRLIAAATAELLVSVNGLLDLARAESGVLHPEIAPVDLRELLSDLRATLRPLAAPGVELTVDVAEPLGAVYTDPVLLTQLVRNLANNAVKFTESGQVSIGAFPAGDDLVALEVRDTGIGIAPEHQHLVFEEFFRVPGHLQVRGKSTGLGLPYAKRVAEALGGTLTMSSSPGEGSVFTATVRSHPPAPIAAPPRLGTVVIGDDDPAYRELLRTMVGHFADTVVEANDASGVLAAITAHRPDVVLLDLRMPGGNGDVVLGAAATDESLQVPIVVVSSSAESLAELVEAHPGLVAVNKADLAPEVLAAAVARAVAGSGT